MFVHFGLYALPAGAWKGREVPWFGEWIMHQEKIPVAEYEKLASSFNPVGFDAKEWVDLTVGTGAKYLVVTAKHHDGFAMFDSEVSGYNLRSGSPFGRDLIAELCEACQERGIKLGLYYSHNQDWHEPDAVGNEWDFDPPSEARFDRYMERKGLPQVRELLTRYGPILLIWYDTPYRITDRQCERFVDVVRELQPACLVNDRVGAGLGDYGSTGDNEIPGEALSQAFEVPMTLNDSWGFKRCDHAWKTAGTVVRMLVETVSKGGNLLINVGPDANGLIPTPSEERLRAVGRWLKRNGPAVFGAGPSPFTSALPFGAATLAENTLYLHVFWWSERNELVVPVRIDDVKDVSTLATSTPLRFRQGRDLVIDLDGVEPDLYDTVIAVEFEGSIETHHGSHVAQYEKAIVLGAEDAQIVGGPRLVRGAVREWTAQEGTVTWQFEIDRAGHYTLEITYGCAEVSRGGDYFVVAAGRDIYSKVESSVEEDRFATHKLSTLHFEKPGSHTLSVKPLTMPDGPLMALKAIRLLFEAD